MGLLSDLFRSDAEAPSSGADPVAPATAAATGDDVPSLVIAVDELVAEINAHAGVLPASEVVLARRVTDALAEVLRAGDPEHLSIDARLMVLGAATDYVPTTLGTYARARRAGHEGADAELHRQLREMAEAARTMLEAVRGHDVRTQQAQGIFLRSRFESLHQAGLP